MAEIYAGGLVDGDGSKGFLAVEGVAVDISAALVVFVVELAMGGV